MLDVRPAVSSSTKAALSSVLATAIDLGDPSTARASTWWRAGLAEATESFDELGAFAAQDARGDARVVEP